jgi:hypothetical protein
VKVYVSLQGKCEVRSEGRMGLLILHQLALLGERQRPEIFGRTKKLRIREAGVV